MLNKNNVLLNPKGKVVRFSMYGGRKYDEFLVDTSFTGDWTRAWTDCTYSGLGVYKEGPIRQNILQVADVYSSADYAEEVTIEVLSPISKYQTKEWEDIQLRKGNREDITFASRGTFELESPYPLKRNSLIQETNGLMENIHITSHPYEAIGPLIYYSWKAANSGANMFTDYLNPQRPSTQSEYSSGSGNAWDYINDYVHSDEYAGSGLF